MLLSFDFVALDGFDSQREFAALGVRLKARGEASLRADVLEWFMSIQAVQGSGAGGPIIWRPLFSAYEIAYGGGARAAARSAALAHGGLRRHGFMVAFALRKPNPLIIAVSDEARSTVRTNAVESAMKARVDRCADAGVL